MAICRDCMRGGASRPSWNKDGPLLCNACHVKRNREDSRRAVEEDRTRRAAEKLCRPGVTIYNDGQAWIGAHERVRLVDGQAVYRTELDLSTRGAAGLQIAGFQFWIGGKSYPATPDGLREVCEAAGIGVNASRSAKLRAFCKRTATPPVLPEAQHA